LLKSIYGLSLDPDEFNLFRECTGRSTYTPGHVFAEVTVIAGARSGKDSRIAAPIACYEAIFGQHESHLARGGVGMVPLVAQDTKGTRVAYGYIKDYLLNSPLLRSRIAGEPLASEITLTNKMVLSCFPCTLRSLRGYSIPCGILDEVGFYRLEGTSDADTEIQASVRRGMINFPSTKLIKISTPYLKSGILFDDFKKGYGTADPDLLVWRASSSLMNPTLKPSRLDRERRLDPARAAREYDAIFSDDLDAFIARAWVEACVIPSRHGLTPQVDQFVYYAAIDATGGGADAFTCAIVHLEGHGTSTKVIQDYVKGWSKTRTSQVDLESVVTEIVTVLRAFGCEAALSDHYAKNWVVQSFARHGITLIAAPEKSVAYLELEPCLAEGRIELLDHPTQTRELGLLERHNRVGGKTYVDHPKGAHDDFPNVLALAVYACLQANVDLPNEEPDADEIAMMQSVFEPLQDLDLPDDFGRTGIRERF
jgi:hypothetical protein